MRAVGHAHLVSLSACEAWWFQPPDNRPVEIQLQIDSPENGINLSMDDIKQLWVMTQAHQLGIRPHSQHCADCDAEEFAAVRYGTLHRNHQEA